LADEVDSRMTLKTAIKTLIYRSGLLPAWHHWRARSTLTVAMFHRVLARGGPRWEQAEPAYTVSDRLFVECLEFFRRHYSVVSLDDVLAARRGLRPLPPRALLITFDDGWLDNLEVALPPLQRAGLPAVGSRSPASPVRMGVAKRALLEAPSPVILVAKRLARWGKP
jgi:hypothetical protein